MNKNAKLKCHWKKSLFITQNAIHTNDALCRMLLEQRCTVKIPLKVIRQNVVIPNAAYCQ
jgi:hypothetical protein